TPSTFQGLLDRVAFWRAPAPAREPPSSAGNARRAELVNDLKVWMGDMRYPVEVGFTNGAAVLPPTPMPWRAAAGAAMLPPELVLRRASLEQLHERHILRDADYKRQLQLAEGLSAQQASRRWTAEELTVVKAATDQASGSVGYFGADLLYTGTIVNASQLWSLDQFLDLVRYTMQEYLWQKFGPRKLAVDEIVAFPGA